jgi:cytochrome c peroxidase
MPRFSPDIIIASCLSLALSACTGAGPATGPDTGTETDTDTETHTDMETDSEPPVDEPQSDALDLPDTPYNYADIKLPAHYTASLVRDNDNTPADNPITNDGATLGRVLFYDKALSANRSVACASCHAQEHGFSDTRQFSRGFDGGLTGRNSMGLAEARYYRNGRFFWDERAETLEDQVLMPIQNAVEMGLTLDELVKRVEGQDYYPPLFKKAFGDEKVTSERVSRALAQFVRSIVSFQSRFDEGMEKAASIADPFPGLAPQENLGKALFLGKAGCATCHLDNGPPPAGTPPGQPPPRVNFAVFFIDVATNNGLPPGAVEDNGVGDISGNPADDNRFKSPSLRNVALTAPYMHDGRFETLAEVVDHYDSGVQASPSLDPRLRLPGSNEPRKLNLTAQERAALVAFLGTLTDDVLLNDPKYESPFVKDAP